MSDHKCCKTVYEANSVWSRGHQCGRKAAYEHEGQHYCKTHHPPTVQARREAKHAEWQRRWNADRAADKAKREALAEQERRAACFPELLEAAIAAEQALRYLAGTLHADRLAAAIAKATGQP